MQKLTMKRKLLYLTTIILTLVGCASEDYVGNHELHEANENGRPVSFNLVAAPQTRAVGGEDAADLLDDKFVVYARKNFPTASAADPQLVFNNYLVQYADYSANSTTSNSAGWEYVGYYNLPSGTTGHTGIPAAIPDPIPTTGRYEQSIKYWDFAAEQYDFLAYSLGEGTGSTPTYADASGMDYDDETTLDAYKGYKYTLTGSAAQLQACYISNLEKKSPNTSSTEVQLKFRKLETKVRIALYETIPGYSVKDVKFYQSASGSSDNTAYLYGSSNFVYGDGGTLTVTFADDAAGTPKLKLTGTASSAFLSFGDITSSTWTGKASSEYREASGSYIGRSSSNSTISDYQSVLPNPDNAVNLNLKVDYTLVSRDGYGEEIKVEGVTATVPAAYAQWQPNYSYTYIFKITDTNLYPITLDAVVTQNPDGKQETITTVTEPSITTFGVVDGKYSVGKSEYEYGADIYATIMEGNSVVEPKLPGETGANVKVYTVAYKSDATADQIAAYPITEGSVADVIGKTGTVIEATEFTSSEYENDVESVTSVPGEDGSTKTIDALKLQKPAAGIYAVEYTYTESSETKKVYKVIRVVPSISVYQAPNGYEEVDEYAAGTAYVVVNKEDGDIVLTEGTNANLYTATLTNEATLGITEATVAQALAEGSEAPTGTWTLTGGLTVTKVTSGLTNFTSIPNTSITVKGVSFTAAASTNYVFEYIYTDPTTNRSRKIYKVIKVASGS